MNGRKEHVEAAALERLALGDMKGTATLLLEGYGAEIFGFLLSRTRDEANAAEAFSMFAEDLWRGLPAFERRSSLRVWAYTLARHAAIRQQAAPHRRIERNVPLSEVDALSLLADRARTETLPFLRTEMRTKLSELQSQLSPDERTLLVLRVDRKLEWVDVARVFFPDDADKPDTALKAHAARLRKRFQQVKSKVRRLAEEAGLVKT